MKSPPIVITINISIMRMENILTETRHSGVLFLFSVVMPDHINISSQIDTRFLIRFPIFLPMPATTAHITILHLYEYLNSIRQTHPN